MLADSATGYNYNFDVYTGREEDEQRRAAAPLAARVVMSLTEPLYGKGYNVYFDR